MQRITASKKDNKRAHVNLHRSSVYPNQIEERQQHRFSHTYKAVPQPYTPHLYLEDTDPVNLSSSLPVSKGIALRVRNIKNKQNSLPHTQTHYLCSSRIRKGENIVLSGVLTHKHTYHKWHHDTFTVNARLIGVVFALHFQPTGWHPYAGCKVAIFALTEPTFKQIVLQQHNLCCHYFGIY